jgi:hypothetical protein
MTIGAPAPTVSITTETFLAPVSADIINLQAINTSSFVFSYPLGTWANVYPLASGIFRAHLRIDAADSVVYYEWSTTNRNAAYIQTKAAGLLDFGANPSPGDTITLGSSAVQFLAPGPTAIVVPSATVTMTIASPCVVTWTAHGLPAGTPVAFSTTGSFATGIAGGTLYYVSTTGLSANAFQIADTQLHGLAGTNSIITSGSQSGTITGSAPSTFVVASHGLTANTPVTLFTTGTLPLPFSSGPIYYVVSSLLSTNTFQVAAAPGGTTLIASSPYTQSGIQSFIAGNQVTVAPTATVTFTNGTPGTVNWASHGLQAGTPIVFSSTGNLPSPLSSGTIYYVSSAAIAAGSFTLSPTQALALSALANLTASLPDGDLTISGTSIGTQTATAPSTVLWAANGLSPNTPITFQTTGALPTGIVPGVVYYVSVLLVATNSFQFSLTPGGLPIFTSGTQTGIQTATSAVNAVHVGGSLPVTIVSLVAMLNASVDPQISQCTYGYSGDGDVNITFSTGGTAGNLFALGSSTGNVVPSGPTLTGGGGLLTLTTPLGALANFLGEFVYDCRWESADGQSIVYLFGGDIIFVQGITRSFKVTTPILQIGQAVTIATLPAPLGDGDLILVSDLGGGAAALISRGGIWTRLNQNSYNPRADSFGAISLTVLTDANIQHFTALLTGNITVSLMSPNSYNGAYFKIISPPSLGGFSFIVNGFSLFGNQFVEFVWNGTQWAQIGASQTV